MWKMNVVCQKRVMRPAYTVPFELQTYIMHFSIPILFYFSIFIKMLNAYVLLMKPSCIFKCEQFT